MRTFIAVNFEEAVRERIASAVDTFPVSDPPWRWTRPETWHVTLKFLGEIAEGDVPRIVSCLETVAERSHSFRLELRDFGGFPNLRRPRVLFYAAADGAGPLERLAAGVDRALHDALGLPVETRRFRPHVTIARVKTRLDPAVTGALAAVAPLGGAVQTVASFDLMRSQLRRSGAVYTRLKAFALPPAS